MKSETNFMGRDGYRWWLGVCESRQDPLMLGRLKVRILGHHTESKSLIPTCTLHWAVVELPVTNAAMNGIGTSATGILEGTWVTGYFRDGDSCQDPVVTGSLPGIPEQAPIPTVGFFDPSKPFHDPATSPRKLRGRYYPNDGTGQQNTEETQASLYPRETHPWGCIIGEPDTNRLARAAKINDTIIGVQRRQRDVKIPIAFVHATPTRKWSEPESEYAAQYPYNHVTETESGHIIEFDDTPGAERIHIFHRQGTRVEINQHGDFSMKVVGKRFEVTMENSYAHFQNTMNVTVDGETNIYCRSNANLQVDGDLNVHVQGNYTEKVHGNYLTDIDGNRTVKIGGNDTLDVNGSKTTKVTGDIKEYTGGTHTTGAGSSILEGAGATIKMNAGALLAGDAAMIHWNSGMTSGVPVQPAGSPDVPPFPAALMVWTESRSDGGSDPVEEILPDTNPLIPPQSDC